MNAMTLSELAQRVEMLEARNGRLRMIGIGSVVAALLVTCGAAALKQDVLSANQLFLKDKAGNVRISLGVGDDGRPSLAFFDLKQKHPKMVLSLLDSGEPRIALHGKQPRSALRMGIDEDNSPSIGFSDGDGTSRMHFSLGPEGQCSVVVLDGKGKRRAGLVVGSDDLPAFFMSDNQERPRVGIDMSEDGRPSIQTYDGERARSRFETLRDGASVFNLWGGDKSSHITLGVSKDGSPRASFVDKDGRVVFKVP